MSHPLEVFASRLSTHTLLTTEEINALGQLQGRPQSIPVGTEFVERERALTSVSLVIDGLVARSIAAVTGRRQITAFYVPGDVPDLHSLMQPEATSSLRAVTECHIFRIAHEELNKLIGEFPSLMEAFWRYTVWDATTTAEWVFNVGQRSGAERIAHLLCEMAQKCAAPNGGSFSFSLPVTQTVLAEATGLSAVHVNRSLQILRKEHLVQFDKGTVTIPNWQELARKGDFDDSYFKPHGALRLLWPSDVPSAMRKDQGGQGSSPQQ